MTRTTFYVQTADGRKVLLSRVRDTTGGGESGRAVEQHDRYYDEHGHQVPYNGNQFFVNGVVCTECADAT